MKTRTPVALIVFRRPDLAQRLFDVVRQAQPPKLFVYADGPSPDRPGEDEKCAATRAVFDEEHIDWECEVVRDFSAVNMGPWRRIATGITAAFEAVEECIILEDDCCPHPTFFRFCDEMLERYRDDDRIMHVCGHNFHPESPRDTPYSYSFAWANTPWGYATWRRAWKHFDLAVPDWPALKETDFLQQIVGDNPEAVQVYRNMYDALHANPGEFDGYDYSWSYACWVNHGLAILPNVSMIRNLGFGPDSTHFQSKNSTDPRARMEAKAMEFPLRHPPCMVRDTAADDFIFRTYLKLPSSPTLARRIYNKAVNAFEKVFGGSRGH